MKELNEERALLYGFLSRVYRKEADDALIKSIKNFDYSQFGTESEIDKGFLLLGKVSKEILSTTLLDLARDYARIFIGAGLGKGEGAYPYESIYTSPDRLLMQEARDEVMFLYGSEKLKRSEEFKEPEDHIAFEFEFMAYLCGRVVESQNNESDKAYLEKQKKFFYGHINRWVDMFCDDAEKLARHDFYKAVAQITRGLLVEERLYFSN